MNKNNSNGVVFEPWIGQNYGESTSLFSKKVLILGGSHYGESGEEYPEFTQHIVRDKYLDEECRDEWKSTYTKFLNTVLNNDVSIEERRDFFESVVFFNYLQEFAGDDAYQAKNYDYHAPEHFEAFKAVVDSVKPDIVIAWGDILWNALPNDWGYGEANQKPGILLGNEALERCFVYPFAEGKFITLLGIMHPSSPKFERELNHSKIEALGVAK